MTACDTAAMLPPEIAETDPQAPAVPTGSGENLRIAPAPPIAPPGLAPDQLAQLLDDWAGTIPIRDQVGGRWVTTTLAQLDRLVPLRGAYWRGVFTERYRLGGALPLRLPDSDLSANAQPAAQDEARDQPEQRPGGEDPDRLPG